MAEYAGKSLVIEFGGTDISTSARTAEISEDRGETEKIDVTVKGDTERQHILGFQGADNTTVTCTILADDGGSDPVAALTMGDKDTLDIFPEGKTVNQDLDRLTNAEIISRSKSVPYDGAVEWSITFNSVDAMSYTTYTT